MPNGRILRTRLDITRSVSQRVALVDDTVYGTTQGFHGYAKPGNSLTIDSAWEYSVTRNWVAALDVLYLGNHSTRVAGTYSPPLGGIPPILQVDSGTSNSTSLAPAVEYNWSRTVGVIAGFKWTVAGRNTSDTFVSILAVDLVF